MQKYIDPITLAKIKNLPLVAKIVAEGFLQGLQPSIQRGVGIEFSQYRSYEIGDELARIDWKLFARSDRYFVRETERESEINVWFLMDSSHSMQIKSDSKKRINQWHKLDYAKHLIASLAYLSKKQGDSFAFVGLSDDELQLLPLGNNENHWTKLLLALSRTINGKFFPKLEQTQNLIGPIQKPSIIFLISDFFQESDEIVQFLDKLNHSNCEVVALQLVCNDEINFDYKGPLRFKDIESHRETLVSASSIKKNYHSVYQNYHNQLKKSFDKKNISYCQFNIDEPFDSILYEYLRQRNRIIR